MIRRLKFILTSLFFVPSISGAYVIERYLQPGTTIEAYSLDGQGNLTIAGSLQCGGSCGGSGSGGGMVNPGTGTWTNNFGITVSTIVVNQTNTGNVTAAVFTSTGTGVVIQVNPNGLVSNGYQNKKGAVTIGDDVVTRPFSTQLVLVDSTTDAQQGGGLFEIWEDQPLGGHNDPLIWIHDMGNASNPFLRADSYAPDMEWVNLSTDNVHGLGKWEQAIAYQGIDFQFNNRAWSNGTFETLAYLHPLSSIDSMPGLYFNPQNSVDDVAVIASSDTTGVSFGTLNNRYLGLTAPKVLTNSYNLGLPVQPRTAGQILVFQANRGGNFGVRQTTWTGTDFLYDPTTGVSASTVTFSSATFSAATLAPVTFATLPSSPNGTTLFCPDCTVVTAATCTTNLLTSCVCAGSGPGAFAKRSNGTWYCN